MLSFFQKKYIEAGCDEAGRGCYAGPVYAAAVILPKDLSVEMVGVCLQADIPINQINIE